MAETTTQSWRERFLGIDTIPGWLSDFEIDQFFSLTPGELATVKTRRTPELQLGLALHIGFLARRIAFYSFFFVLGSLLFGSFVLAVFGLSIPVVQVAGGAVVCALAWNVLADIPKPTDVTLDPAQAKLIALGRAITPLTLPMTIDAGAISVAITVGAFHAHSFKNTVIQILAAVIGSAIIALCILLTYRYAHRVSSKIGHTGMMVLIRLSAFIMLCIGVGISWNGIKSLLAEVGIQG